MIDTHCHIDEEAFAPDREEVIARMEELESALEKTLEDVRTKADELEYAADANAYFWDLYGENFPPYVSGQVSGYLSSYEEHIDFLVNWTIDRWGTLMDQLRR